MATITSDPLGATVAPVACWRLMDALGRTDQTGSAPLTRGSDGLLSARIVVQLPAADFKGYLLEATVGSGRGCEVFDVASSVNSVVRYGWWNKFRGAEGDSPSVPVRAAQLAKLHINTVQFCDWFDDRYHLTMQPGTEVKVRARLEASRAKGMRCIAYLSPTCAGPGDTVRAEHRAYNEAGKPLRTGRVEVGQCFRRGVFFTWNCLVEVVLPAPVPDGDRARAAAGFPRDIGHLAVRWRWKSVEGDGALRTVLDENAIGDQAVEVGVQAESPEQRCTTVTAPG